MKVAMLGILLAGCGDGEDPFADTDAGADSDADTDADVDTDADSDSDTGSGSGSECAEAPARLVVLGDSINACVGVGGADADTCGPKIFRDDLAATWAPGVTYENLAVGGAVTEDVPNEQLDRIDDAPGHVLALVYIGGNDLQPYIFVTDDSAENRWAEDEPRLRAEWDRIFAFFDDAVRFPDGVTILMSTQYNPFDDCTAPPYYLSETKIRLLGEFNAMLTEMADARDGVAITDQHGPFLGHGHHYDVDSCPHYQPGLEYWMNDLIHPNEAGHADLAAQWTATAATLYDCP